jgi:NAD(P)-dependent dehydrogenase (short-subunit alcohol dehydrogenase family)
VSTGLLTGLVCVVTGGARGIGRGICERFAEEGASVVVADLERDDGAAVAESVGGMYVHVDVTRRSSLEEARDRIVAQFGRVDVVAANAGVLRLGRILELDELDWERTLDVNLTGVYRTCQVFGRQMREQGAGGRLLVTSSVGGKRGAAFCGAYAASKFGVIGLVRSLAREVAADGILVNCVCPGSVDTEMMAHLVSTQAAETGSTLDEAIGRNAGSIALGRWAAPQEIGDVFVFLASPLARYVTGQTIVVDGGMLARAGLRSTSGAIGAWRGGSGNRCTPAVTTFARSTQRSRTAVPSMSHRTSSAIRVTPTPSGARRFDPCGERGPDALST